MALTYLQVFKLPVMRKIIVRHPTNVRSLCRRATLICSSHCFISTSGCIIPKKRHHQLKFRAEQISVESGQKRKELAGYRQCASYVSLCLSGMGFSTFQGETLKFLSGHSCQQHLLSGEELNAQCLFVIHWLTTVLLFNK